MNFCRLSDPEARGARHSELAAVEGTQRNKSRRLEDAEAEHARPGPAPGPPRPLSSTSPLGPAPSPFLTLQIALRGWTLVIAETCPGRPAPFAGEANGRGQRLRRLGFEGANGRSERRV